MEQAVNDAAEAHKADRADRCRSQGDRDSLICLRDRPGCVNTGTDARKKHHRQHEAQTGTDRIDHRLGKIVAFIQIEDGNAEHRTVGGNQRKIDSQCSMQGWDVLFQRNLDELYQSC